MDAWFTYRNRMNAHGKSKREASFIREERYIESKLRDTLSYHMAEIYPCAYGYNIQDREISSHMKLQEVAIDNTDNLNEKTIYSLPGEDIEIGSLVHWMDNYWLVYERDANNELYTKAKLLQCNHLLKWIADDKKIIEQWCVIEDGTKYLSGEYEDRNFATTRGDSRVALQLAKNEYSNKLSRKNRFLIDDDDSPHKLSYQLTKPLKKGMVFNGVGSFKFVLQEVTATEYDNHELGIADYYRYFSRETGDPIEDKSQSEGENGKKVWI